MVDGKVILSSAQCHISFKGLVFGNFIALRIFMQGQQKGICKPLQLFININKSKYKHPTRPKILFKIIFRYRPLQL